MRLCSLFVFASFLPAGAIAQLGTHQDLKTQLQDAAYVLNRFEEVTVGLDTEIDTWNIPADSKKLFKKEIATVEVNVKEEKRNLYPLLSQDDVKSSDLFEVYSEIVEVASELSGQASNFSIWSPDPRGGLELAQLGSKAAILGANIGNTLRFKMADDEARLNECSSGKQPRPTQP